MEKQRIIKFSIIFLLGFLSANIVNLYLFYGLESPFSLIDSNTSSKAPSNFINENNIKIYNDKIIIDIEGASISRYASTGSMIPLLDENSNGIRIEPKSEKDINIGDIVTFRKNNNLIVHRVIEKGSDEKGVYFITRGDNNSINDGKIRFEDIKYITIGVLW